MLAGNRFRSPKRKMGGRGLLAMLGLATFMALPAVPSLASAKPASRQPAKTVKPDYKFFRGQTIQILVTNAPGTSSADEANNIQQYMSVALDANVQISYDTSPINVGASVVAGETPDGLHLGVVDLTAAVIDPFYNETETFNPKDLSYVGGSPDEIHGIVACKNSPFTTPEQLISGTYPVQWPAVFPGESYLSGLLFLRAYGVPVTILPGFTGATSFPSCLAGQGNFATSLITGFTSSAGTSVDPGITPMLLSGEMSNASPQSFLNNQVPTMAQFAAKHVPTTANRKRALALAVSILATNHPNEVLFGPHGISAAKMLALTDAMKAAFKQATVIAGFAHNTIPARFFGPADILLKIKQIQGSEKLIYNMTGKPAGT